MRSTKLVTPTLAAMGVLLVAALGAAVWFGYGWARAVLVEKPAASARDDALTGVRQAAINLSSLDSADLDGSIAAIESSITGDKMRDDVEAVKQLTAQLERSGRKVEAEVTDATLTEFSADGGTAKAIVVLATVTTRPEQPPSRQQVLMRLDMRKVDGVWKASDAEPVGPPVATTADATTADGAVGVPTPQQPAPAPERTPGE